MTYSQLVLTLLFYSFSILVQYSKEIFSSCRIFLSSRSLLLSAQSSL